MVSNVSAAVVINLYIVGTLLMELAFQSIWDILEPFLPLTFAMETCILATVRADY